MAVVAKDIFFRVLTCILAEALFPLVADGPLLQWTCLEGRVVESIQSSMDLFGGPCCRVASGDPTVIRAGDGSKIAPAGSKCTMVD